MKNVVIALNQLANTLTGGRHDETISSRAYRCNLWIQDYINWLFGDKDHCRKAYLAHRHRC